MADAVFYDGESARRRTVSLRITASSLDLHEGPEWIASWPVGAVRRRDAPNGILRLACESGPSLARLDVTDGSDQAAVLARCTRLREGEHKERTGRILLWSALAALSIAFCVLVLLPVAADRVTPFIPDALERRLGRAVDNQVRAIFGRNTCGAPAGVAALEQLAARLRAAGRVQAQTSIAVLDSRIPNAIALPGGRIYLFRALLERSESPDEIAGVLGHEIGHVVNRDSLRKLIQSGGTSYLLGLLFGDVTGGGAIVLASQMLVETAYSREAEATADDFAARIMVALGRPAHPMALLLKRIDGNETRLPAFLSTHPVTDQRLKALEKQAPSQPGEPLLTQEEWRALKEICKTT